MFNRIILSLIFFISTLTQAQPIKIIVPFTVGGQVDIIAREAEKLIERELKRPVVVEYRVGAGGSIGISSVARNKTNEVVIMTIDTNVLANAIIIDNLDVSDFRYLNLLGTTGTTLATVKNSPLGNIKNWNKINRPITIGVNGYGGAHHYYTYMLGKSMGIEFIIVPYKGIGSAMNDLMGGIIDVMWGGVATFTPHEQAGKIDMIATMSPRRLPYAPHIPTFTELGLNAGGISHWTVVANSTADPETLRQITELFQRLPAEFYTKTNILSEKGSIESLLKLRIKEQREFAEIVKASKLR
jgi:tripartite-type tricarboxylate transporter receptor subunit TctC